MVSYIYKIYIALLTVSNDHDGGEKRRDQGFPVFATALFAQTSAFSTASTTAFTRDKRRREIFAVSNHGNRS